MTLRPGARRLGIVLACVVGITAALTGCSSAGPNTPTGEVVSAVDCLAPNMRYFADYTVTPTPSPDPAHLPAPEAGRTPPGFVPASAVLCSGDVVDGSFSVTERHLSGPMSELRAALAVRSDAPTSGACSADYEIVPELWIVDSSGDSVRMAWPVDGCGKTKPATQEALDRLDVSQTIVHTLS
ncbi:hypothetical protein [Naasia lichenicola]|uniref:DUF3558 domain-containing protein n=1 Tax=Naasia lichenicola TaxID=2565933 RepID=A0A4S4FEF4_9MICO|nr:hypothetical protein [Naasia lichenicola]THG28503.1 hypothetical protein E6C64_16910 [Naasia lichenicola]